MGNSLSVFEHKALFLRNKGLLQYPGTQKMKGVIRELFHYSGYGAMNLIALE
jgi:hypothetical protein